MPDELPTLPQKSKVQIVREPDDRQRASPPIYYPTPFINKTRAVAAIAILILVVVYREFWWEVLSKLIDFLEKSRSATVYSMVFLFGFRLVYGITRSPLPMKQILRQWQEAAPIIWRSVSAFAGFLAIVAFVVIIFACIPQVYLERKSALARLTPNGAVRPYETLIDEIAAAKAGEDKERKGRIKAEEEAERNRLKAINWLIANTNTSTAIPVLDEAIAVAHREREAMSTNPSQLATLLQREAELKKLESRKTLEQKKDRHAYYQAMLLYVISGYQDRLSALVNKCGDILGAPPTLPSLDWWLPGDNSRINSISTNCGIVFEYSFWRRGVPTTIISIGGTKTNAARAEFSLNPEINFESKFYLGDRYEKVMNCPVFDKVTGIKDVDYILDLLFESQKEGFK